MAVYRPDDVERLRNAKKPGGRPAHRSGRRGANQSAPTRRETASQRRPCSIDLPMEGGNEQQPPAVPFREKVFLLMPEGPAVHGFYPGYGDPAR